MVVLETWEEDNAKEEDTAQHAKESGKKKDKDVHEIDEEEKHDEGLMDTP